VAPATGSALIPYTTLFRSMGGGAEQRRGIMTNALTEQLMRALPDGDDPLQRLKQLAQEMGIERPTRRTKRAFLRVAQRLGIECPAETHGSPAPMLDLPPAAEFVVRGREKAGRQTGAE